jgi:hypothetical protein
MSQSTAGCVTYCRVKSIGIQYDEQCNHHRRHQSQLEVAAAGSCISRLVWSIHVSVEQCWYATDPLKVLHSIEVHFYSRMPSYYNYNFIVSPLEVERGHDSE